MARGKKAPSSVPVAMWPAALPGKNEQKLISLSIGNTHLNWALHEGAGAKYTPTVFWRTPRINPLERMSGSLCEVLATYLSPLARQVVFGGTDVSPTKEAAIRASVGRRVPLLSVYFVSTDDEQVELCANLLSDIPCRIFLMQGDDFFTEQEGRYPGMGIDRLATLRAAGDYKGFPALVFDGGTAMTYTAADANGKIMGGGIGPGVQVKLRSLSDYTSALPHISDKELTAEIEGLMDKDGNTIKTIPTFARNPKQSIITNLCHEIATGGHYVIQNFLAKVGPATEANTAEMNDDDDDDKKIENKERLILVTGGDADLIARLLAPDYAKLIELEPSRKAAAPPKYKMKKMRQMLHYGIRCALQRRAKTFPTAEMDTLLIGQRIAKEFDTKDEYGESIFRGSVASVHSRGNAKYPYAVRYDDGDAEDLSALQLYEALELYIKEGERDPEIILGVAQQKIADAQRAVAALAEKNDDVKQWIEKKNAQKKCNVATPSLAQEVDSSAVAVDATGSTLSPAKRPSAEEETASSRKKTKKVPSKLTKAKEKYVGDRVAKFFDGDDAPYFGTIHEFWYDSDDDMDLWRIVYDDEDTEDLSEDELLEVLTLYEQEKAGDTKKK